ncbi:hypothetical protein E3Q05_03173 [Wallemia mellicola]|nr:hypothetical protein E3Q05_03173 [Wallemia mellicola]
MLASVTIFSYYTIWVFVTPIYELKYFPDRKWAIRIPIGLLLMGLSIVGIFTSSVLIKEKNRKRE